MSESLPAAVSGEPHNHIPTDLMSNAQLPVLSRYWIFFFLGGGWDFMMDSRFDLNLMKHRTVSLMVGVFLFFFAPDNSF